MEIVKNKLFFLLICLISSNLCHTTKCSTVVDCDDHQPFDTYYEETKQGLEDEINDVNDYMKMVADQLTNDDVIVVRATRTIFPNTDMDMDNTLISDILEVEIEDFACDHPKDNSTSMETTTVPSTKIIEKDENILSSSSSSLDKELREIEQNYCLVEKTPFTAKNLSSIINVEAEIILPRDLQREL